MVIAEPSGVFFSSKVYVYPFKLLHLTQEVVAPSLDEGKVWSFSDFNFKASVEFIPGCHMNGNSA